MTTKNGGGPAFPVAGENATDRDFIGMTLRDYFAAKAIPGVIGIAQKENYFDPAAIAEDAYRVADAMLAARAIKGRDVDVPKLVQAVDELVEFCWPGGKWRGEVNMGGILGYVSKIQKTIGTRKP